MKTNSSAIAERPRDACSTSNRKPVKKLRLLVSTAQSVNDFVFLFLTIVLFLLPYTYKALLAEVRRISDFKGMGHFEAKF